MVFLSSVVHLRKCAGRVATVAEVLHLIKGFLRNQINRNKKDQIELIPHTLESKRFNSCLRKLPGHVGKQEQT